MQELPFSERASGVHNDPFSEQSFAIYWRILALPTLLVLSTLLIARQRIGGFTPWQVVLVETALFFVLSLLLRRQQCTTAKHLMAMNVLAGVVLGLGLALENFVSTKVFYAVFQLITEPVGTALLGAAVGWLASQGFRRFRLPLVRIHQQTQKA